MAEGKKKGFDLAAVLGSVSDLDTGAEGREQLQYIDIQKIHPDPGNFYSLDGLEELAGNIELIGLQQPLRVRPDPEHEDEYIIVSGHRRRAAIELLVKEGKEAFRLVPCLIEGRQESDAMRELRLILANSSTRKLTSADLATQAKKVEELLYKLKEEGTEFPGRMRDHVAQVCQVQASKLGRLKVIRDNLDGEMKEQWEAGDLNESEAYQLAKLPTEHRAVIWAHKGQHSWNRAGAQAVEQYGHRLKRIDASVVWAGCPYDKCDNLAGRREASLRDGIYYDSQCQHCCIECTKLESCKYACPHLSKEIAARKERAAADKKAAAEMKAEREKMWEAAHEKERRYALDCWKRMGKALELSGKSVLWLAEGLDWFQSDVDDFLPLLERGEVTDDNKAWASECPLDGSSMMDIAKTADGLGVSVDYLLCRTDEPVMAKRAPESALAEVSPDAMPRWQTGQPFRSGPYYCVVECEGHRLSMKLNWLNSFLEWHMSGGGGLTQGCEVVGWWPLPEDDPEEDAE